MDTLEIEDRIAGADPMIVESAANFVQREIDLKVLRNRRDQLPPYDPSLRDRMRELGWFGVLIPVAYGGLGLRFADMSAIVEELGKGLMAEPLVASAVLGARALLHGDNEALKQRLLPEVASGSLALALAWQERANTLDPMDVTTTATRIASGYRVSGRKRFVCGADANGYLVSALDDNRLVLLWVPSEAEGITVHPEWRADGSASFVVELNDVTVSKSNVVATTDKAAEVVARALDEATVIVAAETFGVMSAAFDDTLEYMRTRVQFGKPIGTFQALQHRAVDLLLQRNLAASALTAAVDTLDSDGASDARRVAASRAKYRCSDAALRITRDAIQLHGAMGFTDECDIGLYLKRVMVLSAWLGNVEVHKARIQTLRSAVIKRDEESGVHHEEALRQYQNQMSRPTEERDWNCIDDEVFRRIAATFFRDNLPEALRFLPRRPGWDEVKPWYLALSRNGWLAPAWPAEYGGMGLESGKLMIYHEEMGRSGAPRHLEQGINYIGPLLIARGTEEQKVKNTYPAYLAVNISGVKGIQNPTLAPIWPA